MPRTINIYTGNHRTITAIEDQLKILKDIFRKDYEIKINNNKLLVNGLNIIIEGFENPYTVKNLRKFKKENPDTKFILILTEFFSTSLLTKSLNNFEKNYFVDLIICIFLNPRLNLIVSKLIYYTNILKLFLKKNYVQYFKKNTSPKSNNLIFRNIKKIYSQFINFYSKKNYKFKTLLFRTLEKERIKKIFEKISFKIFFKKRFNHLLELCECFDEIFTVHPNITKNTKKFLNKNALTIYPYVPEVKFNKNITDNQKKIILTGNFSIYRKNVIQNLKKHKENNYVFDIGRFESEDLIKNYSFSLNVPQKNKWGFSSPIRILRSISLGQIPLNYKIFNDHPIEKICVEFNEKKPINFDKEILYFKKKFKKNIYKYNMFASGKNNYIKSTVKDIEINKDNQYLKTFFIRSENADTIVSFHMKTYVKNYKIYCQTETKNFFAIDNQKKISKKIFNEINFFKYKEYEIFNLKIKIIENFLKNTNLDYNKFFLIAKTHLYEFIYFNNKFFLTKKGDNLENILLSKNNIKSFDSFLDCVNAFVILEKLKENPLTQKKSFSFLNYIFNLSSEKNYDIREEIKFSLIE